MTARPGSLPKRLFWLPSGALQLRCGRSSPTRHTWLADSEANCWTLPVDFDRFLFDGACVALGGPELPEEFCWFHGTRVPSSTTFQEGLLPLGAVVPSLQPRLVAALDEQAEEAVRRAFASRGGLTMHFGNKLRSPTHGGAYAILVRELAEHARDLGQHDYFAMPEIIEDLCAEVQAQCGLKLLPRFEQRLRPGHRQVSRRRQARQVSSP